MKQREKGDLSEENPAGAVQWPPRAGGGAAKLNLVEKVSEGGK